MEKNSVENHVIKVNEETYRLTHDPWTGDWCVDSTDALIQEDYFRTKEGAVEFIMEFSGMIQNGNYEYASDRTF